MTGAESILSTGDHLWNSEHEVGQLLSSLLQMGNGKRVLESGVWFGRTSSYIISSLPEDGEYYGVDIEDHRTNEVKELMSKHKFLLGSSLDVLKKLSKERFDLIFIDSVHEYDYLKKEFPLCEKLLSENGIIAIHDYWIEGVRKYIDELVESNKYYLIPLPTYDSDLFNRGLVLVRPK